MTRPRSRVLLGATTTGLALALALTACGGPSAPQPGDAASSGSGGSGDSRIPDTSSILDGVETDDELASQVPAEIADAGVLQVGSNVQSPPNNFYAADGSTVVGSDHDLITAVASTLGLEVEYQNQDFGSLITSLQSGRVDVTIAAMNDTA